MENTLQTQVCLCWSEQTVGALPKRADGARSARLARVREADAREAPPAAGKPSLRCERDAAEMTCRLQCFRELLFSVNFF